MQRPYLNIEQPSPCIAARVAWGRFPGIASPSHLRGLNLVSLKFGTTQFGPMESECSKTSVSKAEARL